jgi:hypothetical protein
MTLMKRTPIAYEALPATMARGVATSISPWTRRSACEEDGENR